MYGTTQHSQHTHGPDSVPRLSADRIWCSDLPAAYPGSIVVRLTSGTRWHLHGMNTAAFKAVSR